MAADAAADVDRGMWIDPGRREVPARAPTQQTVIDEVRCHAHRLPLPDLDIGEW